MVKHLGSGREFVWIFGVIVMSLIGIVSAQTSDGSIINQSVNVSETANDYYDWSAVQYFETEEEAWAATKTDWIGRIGNVFMIAPLSPPLDK